MEETIEVPMSVVKKLLSGNVILEIEGQEMLKALSQQSKPEGDSELAVVEEMVQELLCRDVAEKALAYAKLLSWFKSKYDGEVGTTITPVFLTQQTARDVLAIKTEMKYWGRLDKIREQLRDQGLLLVPEVLSVELPIGTAIQWNPLDQNDRPLYTASSSKPEWPVGATWGFVTAELRRGSWDWSVCLSVTTDTGISVGVPGDWFVQLKGSDRVIVMQEAEVRAYLGVGTKPTKIVSPWGLGHF